VFCIPKNRATPIRGRGSLVIKRDYLLAGPAGARRESRQHLPLHKVHPLHFEKRNDRAATEWLIDEDAVAAIAASLPTITEPLSLFSVLGVR